MKTPFKVVIPARYAATRLPGKPLRDIAGKPMIVHVCERAQEAYAEEVIVATDDERILQTVNALGFTALMTQANHRSGTERIAEVACILDWPEDTIIVNLQGDEPLIPPGYIRDVADALAEQNRAGIATLAARMVTSEEVFNPNAVKVVLDRDNYALYFSRAPIPWDREHFVFTEGMWDSRENTDTHLRHIGMYAYTVAFLDRYCSWSASPIETIESLEQLRILWHGAAIRVKVVAEIPPAGVDTLEDLQRVELLLQQKISD